MPSTSAVTRAAAIRALLLANLRYWPTVAPLVRRELRHWDARARAIPDPTWRRIALDKLAGEHFNAQVAATLATLAPLRRRHTVVHAIVAAEVLYDFLDGASEHASPDGGAHLYDAFATAFGHGLHTTADYFHDLDADDGGYLQQLALACRSALLELPAAPQSIPAAWQAATRCATAQTLIHRIGADGTAPLRAWSSPQAADRALAWWELAAAGAASILAVHALIASAADPETTARSAAATGEAYLLTCGLSTLLDSLVDRQRDLADGAHSFVAHYPDGATQADRIGRLAASARDAAATLPRPAHHAMTVAGVAGYYLSDPSAREPSARPTTLAVEQELDPILRPILTIFRIWRLAKRGGR